MAGSDARKSLTVLEAAAGAVLAASAGGAGDGAVPVITLTDVEQAADVAAVRYDR